LSGRKALYILSLDGMSGGMVVVDKADATIPKPTIKTKKVKIFPPIVIRYTSPYLLVSCKISG
jgi:hypothetical protein